MRSRKTTTSNQNFRKPGCPNWIQEKTSVQGPQKGGQSASEYTFNGETRNRPGAKRRRPSHTSKARRTIHPKNLHNNMRSRKTTTMLLSLKKKVTDGPWLFFMDAGFARVHNQNNKQSGFGDRFIFYVRVVWAFFLQGECKGSAVIDKFWFDVVTTSNQNFWKPGCPNWIQEKSRKKKKQKTVAN